MKELSIEEKAKRYDKAIEKAKSLYKASEPMSGCSVIIETLFSELKESDGEKIRKALIEGFKVMKAGTYGECTFSNYNIPVTDIIAWLEKQGEQKSWSEEDEEIYRKCICAMRASACGFPEEEKFVEQVDNWFKFLKDRVQPQPNQEWSEEDEKTIHLACEFIRHHSNRNDSINGIDCPILIERLKSLRPQSHWRPSEGQMIALKCAITTADEKWVCMNTKDLESLYEDLKKLTE